MLGSEEEELAEKDSNRKCQDFREISSKSTNYISLAI